jgi:hypothetical protein
VLRLSTRLVPGRVLLSITPPPPCSISSTAVKCVQRVRPSACRFHAVPRFEVTARQILGARERHEGELAKLGRSQGVLLGLKHLVPSTGGVHSDVMATAGIAKALQNVASRSAAPTDHVTRGYVVDSASPGEVPITGPREHLAKVRTSRPNGGRTWWAHFEFTRTNIEPTILRKKIEDLREARASAYVPPRRRAMHKACARHAWMPSGHCAVVTRAPHRAGGTP